METLRRIDKKVIEENIEREEAGVQKSKERGLKQKAFENFITIEAKKLFGENVEVVPASHFDDIVNKIDIILEIKEGDKIIRLGIDASVTDVLEFVHRKILDNSRNRIRSGQTGVNYFKSVLEPDFKGNLENIPKVAIIIPEEQLGAIMQSVKNEKEKLPDVQSYLFESIKSQLESQFAYVADLNESKIKVENIMKSKEGSTLRLRHKDQELVDNFYNSLKNISSKGNWKDLPELIKLFGENPIFKKESVVNLRYRDILLNIASSLSWIYKEKEVLEKVSQKETTPFGGAVANAVLSHWKPDDFRV